METSPSTTTLKLVPRRRRPDGSEPTGARTVNVTVRPDLRVLLSVNDAAERLDIGRTLPYELIADGELETIHVGRLHKVPVSSLTDYVERQRVHARSTRSAG